MFAVGGGMFHKAPEATLALLARTSGDELGDLASKAF